MKNIILFLIINLLSFLGYNQNIIIVDSVTKESIPYAIIKNNDSGIYTDHNGSYSINELTADSITINHLQYQTKTIAVENVKDTVFLHPKTQNLEEVVILEKRNKTTKIKKTRKSKAHVGFPLPKNQEILLKIIPKRNLTDKIIKQLAIEYRAVNPKNYLKAVFRINFYDFNNNEISSLIYSSEPIIVKPRKKGEITLNLKNTFIEIVDSGIVIGVEFIGYLDNNKLTDNANNNFISLGLTDKENKYYSGKTFYRNPLSNEQEIFSINEIRSSQLNKEFNDNLRIELIVSE